MTLLDARPTVGHRAHALVAVALAAPVLAALLRSPYPTSLPTPSTSNALIAYPVVLLAAGLLYLCWSRSRARVEAWLVMVLVFVGVQGLGLPVLAHGLAPLPEARGAWFALVDVVVLLVVLGAIGFCERVDLDLDPLLAGLAAGLALIVARALVLDHSPPWPMAASADHWVSAILVVLNVAIGWRVLRLRTLPEQMRARLAATAVLLGAGTAAASSGVPDGIATSTVALVADLGCAVLLGSTAVGLLLRSVEEHSTLVDLQRRVTDLQGYLRGDRARIHEVNATLAGLASASALMQSGSARVSAERRRALEAMMQSELLRLQRLLHGEEETAGHADLDESIRHLVVAHEVRGHTVSWQPSGLYAATGADVVSEAVNILLDNACRHGSLRSRVSVVSSGGQVQIVVSDDGPGIRPELRPRIFDRGVRGPHSRGQGTGLGIARDLVHRHGGSLVLTRSSPLGSTFTIVLPRHPDGGRTPTVPARPATPVTLVPVRPPSMTTSGHGVPAGPA